MDDENQTRENCEQIFMNVYQWCHDRILSLSLNRFCFMTILKGNRATYFNGLFEIEIDIEMKTVLNNRFKFYETHPFGYV